MHDLLNWSALGAEAKAAWVQAIGSVGAIFVAIGVAWWQARQSRLQLQTQRREDLEQRKVASRPHVTIEEFTQLEKPRLRIYVKNNGVGAAVVTSLTILLDGRPLRADRRTFWQRVISQLGLPPGIHSGGTVLADGQTLPAGSKQRLFRYQPSDARQVDSATLHAAVERIDYEIEYASIYGERFTFRSRSIDTEVSFDLADPE